MLVHSLLLAAALASLASLAAADDIAEDARLDVPQLVRKYGYPLEEHTVTTEDGYVLTAHRIPHSPHAPPASPAARRTPVLLMHGLLCSSADFLVLGPGRALGYVLADAGYDVWLGNARGNYYSRRHVALDPDADDFWRFSWDEIGERDVPALVRLVRARSGRRRLHYVGYSQGTTALLVLLALRPRYNRHFLSFHALAPAAFTEYSDDPVRDALVHFERVIDRLAFRYGFAEVLPRRALVGELALRLCRDGAPAQPLCARLLLGTGDHFNQTLLPVFAGHNPAGAGVRQLVHFAQVQRFGRFARFDHGARGNLARYGAARPPAYDVARVRVPTHLYYGAADRRALPPNVLLLARRLRAAAPVLHRVPRDSFAHYDFIWGADARAQLYDHLVATVRRHDRDHDHDHDHDHDD